MVYLITTTPMAHKVVKAKLVKVAAFIRLDKSPIRINRVVAHAWVENNISIVSVMYDIHVTINLILC